MSLIMIHIFPKCLTHKNLQYFVIQLSSTCFFLDVYSTACNLPKWSSCRIGCQPFYFLKITPKCLTSNPLSQIVTSNPRLQPDTHFAVDMFPYKKTELFQKAGFKSKPPKKPGNTPLSGPYLSFLDIKTTVSTCER